MSFSGYTKILKLPSFVKIMKRFNVTERQCIRIMSRLLEGRQYMGARKRFDGKLIDISMYALSAVELRKVEHNCRDVLECLSIGTKVNKIPTPIIFINEKWSRYSGMVKEYLINPKYLARGICTIDTRDMVDEEVTEVELKADQCKKSASKVEDLCNKDDLSVTDRVLIRTYDSYKHIKYPTLQEVQDRGNEVIKEAIPKKGKLLISHKQYESKVLKLYISLINGRRKSDKKVITNSKLYLKYKLQVDTMDLPFATKLLKDWKDYVNEMGMYRNTKKFGKVNKQKIRESYKSVAKKKYGIHINFNITELSKIIKAYNTVKLEYSDLNNHIELYKTFLVNNRNMPTVSKGRMTDPITSLPEWQRRMLHIKGEEVDEVDIHAMHPSILFGLANKAGKMTQDHIDRVNDLFNGNFYVNLTRGINEHPYIKRKPNEDGKDIKFEVYEIKLMMLSFLNIKDEYDTSVIREYFQKELGLGGVLEWMRDVKKHNHTNMSKLLFEAESKVMLGAIDKMYDINPNFAHYGVYDGIGCALSDVPEMSRILNNVMLDAGYCSQVGDRERVIELSKDEKSANARFDMAAYKMAVLLEGKEDTLGLL